MSSVFSFLPKTSEGGLDWNVLMGGAFAPSLQAMAATPQNPAWHGEGDVLTHTRMVCDALTKLPGWLALDATGRDVLLCAALMHDIAKPKCTRLEDGVLVSPKHAVIGAELARGLLWRAFGLCGTPEAVALRESVCCLIRCHTTPVHIVSARDAERTVRKIAAMGFTAKFFSNASLCLLAQADMLGRIANDIPEALEAVELYAELSRECGCYNAPGLYASAHSRFAYLSGRNVPPGQPLYDDAWGEVLMLSGLPASGKDTWLKAYRPELPVISLDDIRDELRVPPDAPQGSVIAFARERAKEYLRRRQPFAWNATSLTPLTREKQISLFGRYGAATRIIYLETDLDTLLQRNASRGRRVPEDAIDRMLNILIPPSVCEAREAEWLQS